MAQNSFRPYRGKWLMKRHVLKATAGVVEKGDLIMVTSGGVTVELATTAATAIIGIAAEDLATSTATQTIRVLEPTSKMCEMIGRVTAGAIAVGYTDSGRVCEAETHEGIDVDTTTGKHFTIVKGTVASADGSATAGEAIFRIAQTLDNLSSW